MAYIKLNRENFFKNLQIITEKAKDIKKVALVLKDNAYGHGLELVSSMASEFGITKAVVKDEFEAAKIENYFEYILILAPKNPKKHQKFHYTINSLEQIKNFEAGCNVELKTDSGMHRNGVALDELDEAFALIKKQNLALKGVFTHHRSADELSSEWFWQKQNFKHIKDSSISLAQKYGFEVPKFHSSNSAALFRESEFSEDLVRVGIAAYGCLELPAVFGELGFEPVLSLWAKKNSTRALDANTRVGYGGDGVVPCEMLVSNYDIGYGDGFFRVFAQNGYKTPDGAKLLGRVSMDNSSFMSGKDELLIFDDARVASRYAKTISYEVLTSLKEGIFRSVEL